MIISRNQIADLLKGIAVVLMIQVHIVEKFATDVFYISKVGKVLLLLGGPAVAPVFMVIMGYFLAISTQTQTQLLLRGIKFFFEGMCLNVLLNMNLFISINNGIYKINPLPFLFGVDILHLAGLSICIIALTKSMLQKSIFITVGCIILIAILGQLLPAFIPKNEIAIYISAFFYGSTEFSYFPLLPWLAYPLAGIFFYQISQYFNLFSNKNIRIISFSISGLFLLFFYISFNYALTISSNLPTYYHPTFYFVIWVIAFVAGYIFFINFLNMFLGKTQLFVYLKWLGNNVTLVYFIQWIIIGNLATKIYKTVASPIGLIIYFAAIMVACIAITFIIDKIKQNQQAL